jgi:hypothetical protein
MNDARWAQKTFTDDDNAPQRDTAETSADEAAFVRKQRSERV